MDPLSKPQNEFKGFFPVSKFLIIGFILFGLGIVVGNRISHTSSTIPSAASEKAVSPSVPIATPTTTESDGPLSRGGSVKVLDNLSTYTDNVYNFSFSYPTDWHLEKLNGGHTIYLSPNNGFSGISLHNDFGHGCNQGPDDFINSKSYTFGSKKIHIKDNCLPNVYIIDGYVRLPIQIEFVMKEENTSDYEDTVKKILQSFEGIELAK